jgi:hypothetical protein
MLHAKSLRVIGQSLEAAGIAAFELEKNDQSYVVESAYVTREGESILRNALGGNDLSSQGAQQSRANRLFCFRAPIFHALTPRLERNEKVNLVQLRGRRRRCLTVCVLWAIILTEFR